MTSFLLHFGIGQDDENYLGSGWSLPELGQRWMIGQQSELWLENPGAGSDCTLELALVPFVRDGLLAQQELAVQVRGCTVGRSVIQRSGSYYYRIPKTYFAGAGPVRITFIHPGARRPTEFGHPSDDRMLALAVRSLQLYPMASSAAPPSFEPNSSLSLADIQPLTGLTPEELMLQFESLGDNCEFGLLQRRCGAEPLGLLRFSNIDLPNLTRGIETGLDGLADPARLELSLSSHQRPEFIVRNPNYRFTFHTFTYLGSTEAEQVLAKQARRLDFLVRKLMEDVQEGFKTFVCKGPDIWSAGDVRALHAALRRRGPCTLLWVGRADAEHPAGLVEEVSPGLLYGYIDRFAPYENAHDFSLDVWIRMCVNAYLLRSRRGDSRSAA